MTRKQQNKKTKEKRKQKLLVSSTRTKSSEEEQKTHNNNNRNFVDDAGPGCYIARRDLPTDWIIGWEDIDPEEYFSDDNDTTDIPDIAVDIDEQTLSVCNVQDYTTIAYVTVYETQLMGGHGEVLSPGTTVNNKGVCESCITFIVLCPPCVFVHLCYLDVPNGQDITSLRIDSHVSQWEKHPNPTDEHPLRLGFPLSGGPFLCTQSEGGELTHFFSGNLHAIDFRCPIGTELLSVANGVVVDVKDNNTVTGIAVSNLFVWNSIMIQVEEIEDHDEEGGTTTNTEEVDGGDGNGGPLFVEYVHIQTSLVQVGDKVTRGQMIGRSGSVGFSPEPHLHFSAFRSSDPMAPTVRVHFQCDQWNGDDTTTTTNNINNSTNSNQSTDPVHCFLPQAGRWYDSSGEVTRRIDSTT